MTERQTDSRVLEESRQNMTDLLDLIAELSTHTQRLRAEVAALSFMTMVQASEATASPETVDRLGGERGVRTAVVMLYERVMADPELAPYFAGADMMRIRQRQVDMFLALFGIRDFRGKSLKIVHEPLHVTADHFRRLMDHVTAVLVYLGVPATEVAALVDRLRPFEKEIVHA